MAKEDKKDVPWFKIVSWAVGMVFAGGMLYGNITGNTKGIAENRISIKEEKADLDAHKEDNLATEKEQEKKHDAIIERQHQGEMLAQRQIAVTESVAVSLKEAKIERKEMRDSLSDLVKSQIKLESELSKWEPTD